MSRRHRAALAVLLATLAGCSPALNWREVRLERLVALLPCKPDQAQRDVQLGARTVAMQMSGCEAAGGLYAISHVRVADRALVGAAQAAWRQASLAHLHDSTVQALPFQLAKPKTREWRAANAQTAAAPVDAVEMLQVQAKRPDGSPMQARLVWLSSGVDLYHVAVYGPHLGPEMSELLFSELALQ